MKQKLPVFVYGTLLEGFPNYERYVRPYRHDAFPAIIKGELYHLPPGYPGLLQGTNEITGTVLYFATDEYESALAGLDELEDYYGAGDLRNEYERIIVPARLIGTANKEVMAYVYRYLNEAYVKWKGIRLAHGDWRRFMHERQTE
ncbi:gamma-glutamylcyclotransferase family protein [Brevibacillus sp. NRS-1366]|uniref:gamma-glutamylcyclotransferase family protein n=1 Tax=Brevibacillus sp. NRS-1366 TaxID=3233899 RepID=UPI003D218307